MFTNKNTFSSICMQFSRNLDFRASLHVGHQPQLPQLWNRSSRLFTNGHFGSATVWKVEVSSVSM